MTLDVYYDLFEDLDSTALDSVFYDSLNRELYVEFKTGTIAGYAGVPGEVYYNLVSAPSAGSFYAHQIKYKYNGISGDVDLHARPVVPEKVYTGPVDLPVGPSFIVLVDVTGTLKFSIVAANYGDAETQVVALMNKAVHTGQFTVRSVTNDS